MTIPAVFKARAILLSLIPNAPIRSFDIDGLTTDQPDWLQRTDGPVSPWHRMAGTLDDLIFYGWSLWAVERDGDDTITAAARVPYELWEFGADGRVLVDKRPVDEKQVVLIPGPSEGLLTYATRSLRGAVALETAWVARAQNPIPALELHETSESGITAEEAKSVVDAWAKARHDPNGAVAFTPYNIEAKALGQTSPDLFTEGRNNTRLDVGNFFALPAALLDGSMSTASLTYSTQEGQRNELFDYAIPYWVGAIEGRLSQDDVSIPGNRVRFDFAALLQNPQTPIGAITED